MSGVVSTRHQARIAGLLYGMASSLAPFAFFHVPGRLLVPNDALATAEHVRSSETLLRAAVFCELYGATILLFAALAMYQLFKKVDARTSALMAAMMLVSVPISYVNALSNLTPLLLLKSPAIVSVLTPGQVAAQVMLFLRLHNLGLVVNQIFWGLWLFPVGLLVLRSSFIPRWLGYPLFFAGAGYVLHSLGSLFLPASLRWTTEYLQVLGVGELPLFGFYLLIWGARGHAVDRLAAFMVIAMFVAGAVGLVMLTTHRIDAMQYGAIKAASLVVVIALVLRWRSNRAELPAAEVAA